MKEKTFKKGDRVNDLVEVIEFRGFHKVTGKPNKPQTSWVRKVLLTLVKR